MVTMAGALTLSGCAKNTESGSGGSAGPTKSTVEVKTSQKVEDIAATVPEDTSRSPASSSWASTSPHPNEFADLTARSSASTST